MPNKIEKIDHYNLYYIFKEDKEKNRLQKNKALDLWQNIINNVDKEIN